MELALRIPVLSPPEHCSSTSSSPDQHQHHQNHHLGFEDHCPPPGSASMTASSSTAIARQPLQESTANIQHHPPHQHHHMAWDAQHQQHQHVLSSIAPGLIPPVLRTQSASSSSSSSSSLSAVSSPIGDGYGTTAYNTSGGQALLVQQKLKHHQQYGLSHGHHTSRMASGRRRSQQQKQQQQQQTHPFLTLLGPAYQTYRKKQEDKPDQKWPMELEAPFFDAVLLIPQMGKDKYNTKGGLKGRNQLIGEYLVLAFANKPPSATPDMLRPEKHDKLRKRVSSHIQVIKNFFKSNRCFHMLFGEKPINENKDPIRGRDGVKSSLKKHPVFLALSEDRLPLEQPNFEYFQRVLALNNLVQFRPSRCWIFVSHPEVVVGQDGTGYVPSSSSSSSSSGAWQGEEAEEEQQLTPHDWPHLTRNLERDAWPKDESQLVRGALLHEFARECRQEYAFSVRMASQDWDLEFPPLWRRLKEITATVTDATCEFLSVHVRLQCTPEGVQFPAGSNFSAWVEVGLEGLGLGLVNQRWRVETRLVRPGELRFGFGSGMEGRGEEGGEKRRKRKGGGSEYIHEGPTEITAKYAHRPGCEGAAAIGGGGGAGCGCFAQQQHHHHYHHQQGQSQRGRREGGAASLHIPFPAGVFAEMLAAAAQYPPHAPVVLNKEGKRERACAASASSSSGIKREDGDAGISSISHDDGLTQMDLLPRIAMLQEISSCPPPSSHAATQDTDRWTLRAVVLWTFESLYRWKKNVLEEIPSGVTEWRFLTLLDPLSEHHQQNAILSPRGSSSLAPKGASSASSSLPSPTGGLMVDDYKTGLGAYPSSHLPSISTSMSAAAASKSTVVVPPSPTYSLSLGCSGGMTDGFSPCPWDGSSTPGGLGGFSGYGGGTAAATAPFLNTNMTDGTGYSDHGGSFASTNSYGLDTPPPSASFTTSFSQNFDALSTTTAELLPGYLATTTAAAAAAVEGRSQGMENDNSGIDGGLVEVTDPFLAHVGTSYAAGTIGNHGGGDIASAGTGWDGRHGSFDPWTTTTTVTTTQTTAAGYADGSGAMDWSSQEHQHQHQQQMSLHRGSTTSTSTNSSNGCRPQRMPLHRPHRRHHPWVPSITTTTTTSTGSSSSSSSSGVQDHDPWTPIHSAHTSSSSSSSSSSDAGVLSAGLDGYLNPLSTTAGPAPSIIATAATTPTTASPEITSKGSWIHILPAAAAHNHHHNPRHLQPYHQHDPTSAMSATSTSSFSSVTSNLSLASTAGVEMEAEAVDDGAPPEGVGEEWVDVQYPSSSHHYHHHAHAHVHDAHGDYATGMDVDIPLQDGTHDAADQQDVVDDDVGSEEMEEQDLEEEEEGEESFVSAVSQEEEDYKERRGRNRSEGMVMAGMKREREEEELEEGEDGEGDGRYRRFRAGC